MSKLGIDRNTNNANAVFWQAGDCKSSIAAICAAKRKMNGTAEQASVLVAPYGINNHSNILSRENK